MAKSRFGGLQDTMQTAQDVIQEAKNAPIETAEPSTAPIVEEPAKKGKKGRKPYQ